MIPRDLRRLDDAAANCMKCGFCKAECPVFLGGETTSPRAKVRLARAVAEGDIELTAGVKRQMARCLNCRACAVECPSGVEPNKIVLAMRAALVDRDGLPLAKRLGFAAMLARPRLAAWCSRAVGLMIHVLALDVQNNPVRLLLPTIGLRSDKDLPTFGRRSLFSRLPETLPAAGNEKLTVVYFPGCATNLILPEIGLAAVRVMRALGANVILPRGLSCCSTPVFSSGDLQLAEELARRNLSILSSIRCDYVVTSCGSCGLTIKREWTDVLGLGGADAISKKLLDIAEFVARFVPDDALKLTQGAGLVTYHDSCHLRRGLGVWREPRELLTAILGSNYVEMDSSDACCGGGGTFSLEQPELSQEVAETKMARVAAAGADQVAAGCPACLIQLRDSFVHRKMPQRASHTIELIDRSLRADE